MAGLEMSKWDVQSFITKKRYFFPKCSLQQIKDTTIDTMNSLSTSFKKNSGLEVRSHSRDGDCFNAIDSNGIKQSHELGGGDTQHEHVLPSGNDTPGLGPNTNSMQENQPRPLVFSKRRTDAFTTHEREHREAESISENSSVTRIKASKRFKKDVISPRHNAFHDFESSQRDDVATELSAQIPQAIV